jgi:hypothetical protein
LGRREGVQGRAVTEAQSSWSGVASSCMSPPVMLDGSQ